MSEEKLIKLHPGKRKKHGGYSFLSKGSLPENRAYIERYLTGAREGLIRDLGQAEDRLTIAQIILIDRVISKLGIVRCIEEYIRENSVMKGENLAPSLRKSYLAYNNSIRLDLQALGINKRVTGEGLTPIEFIKAYDERKKKDAEKRVEKTRENVQDRRSQKGKGEVKAK